MILHNISKLYGVGSQARPLLKGEEMSRVDMVEDAWALLVRNDDLIDWALCLAWGKLDVTGIALRECVAGRPCGPES